MSRIAAHTAQTTLKSQKPKSLGEARQRNRYSKHSALHTAVLSRDLNLVKDLLKDGMDPNAQNVNGSTALHFAASKNFVKAIQILIAAGADPLIKNNAGLTPVEIGMFMGSIHKWS